MENRTYIDWHTHTIYSDGLDSPDTVVRNSKFKGIESLAITDHDTLEGYWEAVPEAAKWRIELVPGVEVSTRVYHILGLGIDPKNPEFNAFLEKVQGLQAKVCEQRIEKLQAAGYPITMEKLKDAFPKSRIGKYNIFMAMVQDEACSEMMMKEYGNFPPRDMFRKIFGTQGIAGKIENKYFVRAGEAIAEIHKAGGIAIVAHPFKQADNPENLDSLVEKGLDGLEIQPNYGKDNDPFLEYARSRGLPVTYGSDSHGATLDRPLLGRGENLLDTESFFARREAYA
ncbi:MAG: PHP domain-containing protein [Nanoarchaeota archaeon]|nr:PHP domain-containing protein [Nanoarchaeota archaeon]